MRCMWKYVVQVSISFLTSLKSVTVEYLSFSLLPSFLPSYSCFSLQAGKLPSSCDIAVSFTADFYDSN